MKLTNLPLASWQAMLDEYKRSPAPVLVPPPCFRVDGTQFSVGIYYGGFRYNGVDYTTIPAVEDGAYLACSPAFLAWAKNRRLQSERTGAPPEEKRHAYESRKRKHVRRT